MAQDRIQMIARHLIVGLGGTALSDEERGLLAKHPFAGVILFDRNVRSARQLMELTQDLRRIYRDAHGAVPLIGADHEGGVVSVLARAVGAPPTQMAAGRTGDPKLCDRLFAENARRLRSCGVNLMLGPVADINSDPLNPVVGTRSFGEDEGLVSEFTAAAAGAARREGVLVCLKHFPGHGRTAVDSHLAPTELAATLDDLLECDVRPFARGIAAGAETVMTGHVAPRGRSLPASLDPGIIEGLLRGELGFDGVVMTDALEMEGVRVPISGAAEGADLAPGAGDGGAGETSRPAGRSLYDICRLALEAGNDILLFSRPAAEVVASLAGCDVGLPAGDSGIERFAGVSAASGGRVRRLLDLAAAKERDFELPNDSAVYAEIARRSIRISGEKPIPVPAAPAPRAVFYAERGEFDRHPTMRFIARSLRSLGAAGWIGGGAGSEAGGGGVGDEASRLEPVEGLPFELAGIEGRAFPAGGPDRGGADIVFLLNRRPLPEEAVRRLSAGSRIAVVAGWPYAAQLLQPETKSIVTWGLYDAAADLLGGMVSLG